MPMSGHAITHQPRFDYGTWKSRLLAQFVIVRPPLAAMRPGAAAGTRAGAREYRALSSSDTDADPLRPHPPAAAAPAEFPYSKSLNSMSSHDYLALLPQFSRHIVAAWVAQLSSPPAAHEDPSALSLLTISRPAKFSVGTGHALLSSILPALESTQHELLFITCFWAKSPSLTSLGQCLRTLSHQTLTHNRPRVRVRICFSSLSIPQKLFRPSTYPGGKVYPPSAWSSKFGLPNPPELAGLDLEVRSIFLRPFSVMHPKLVIQDRRRAWVPSFNVSWEEWFEGCLELEGPAVEPLVRFYSEVWTDTPSASLPALPPLNEEQPRNQTLSGYPTSPPLLVSSTFLFKDEVPTLILPSPHHQNPHFHPIGPPPPPPQTPLNTFLLTLFSHATHTIKIYTPNLTSPPVLAALLDALKRGVNIDILTSRKMMILEQLATAGKTGDCAVRTLQKLHKHLQGDEEAAGAVGRLTVRWFEPRPVGPVKSHLKLTVVDHEIAVLGSGNLDRASWWTSQELGVALFGKGIVSQILHTAEEGLEGRTVDG